MSLASHVIIVGPELDGKAVAQTLVANGISAGPVVASDGSVVGIIVRNERKNAIRVAAEGTPGVQAVNDHLRIYS